MKTTLIVIGLVVVTIVVFAIYRVLKVRRQSRKNNEEILKRVKPLYDKIETRQDLSVEDVLPFAASIATRETTFRLLTDSGKAEMFPNEFYTIEKAAESNLANWLEFPTELDSCPDEMELVKKVTIDFDNNDVFYYVFKFRINEPHWAAKDGWMLGVVGPYFEDSKPYDFPGATFSRLSSKLDSISPEEEAKWVHENISLKRS